MFSKLFSASHLGIRTVAQFSVVMLAGSVGLSIAASSASSGLDAIATNGTAQTIATGTLGLTPTNGLKIGGASSLGFGSNVSGMVPKDIRSFYVNLTTGSMAGSLLTVSIIDTATATSLLTRDETKGLQVEIRGCGEAWGGTISVPTCGAQVPGTFTNLLYTPITGINKAILSTNSATLMSGEVAASTTIYLRISLKLPDQNETSTNGQPAVPESGTTIQGLTASINWTFKILQRTETNTDL